MFLFSIILSSYKLSFDMTSVYLMLTGSILIDNHNIQNIRLQSLRRHVGLVSQDVVSNWQIPVSILLVFVSYVSEFPYDELGLT